MSKQKVKIDNAHAQKSDKTQLSNQFKPFFEALKLRSKLPLFWTLAYDLLTK